MSPAKRQVTLVLCTSQGQLLGALPPFEVQSPWWRDAEEVVLAARACFGVDVVMLRLLSATPSADCARGATTYLAEVATAPKQPLAPYTGDPLREDPNRLPYARPGGPAADLAWADEALVDCGTPRTGPPIQVRTWNLSSLWRLPTMEGTVWLKVVPPFFAHEGAVLARLDPAVVPALITTSGPRALLRDVPGTDQYDAARPALLGMVALLVDLQQSWIGRVDELLSIGLPDWRAHRLSELATDAVRRNAGDLDASTVATLDTLIAELPRRWAEIEACGIPDTLVHGDFHPGNVRGDDGRLVLLDWGDCGVGHPLLDDAAFTERLSSADRIAVRAAWQQHWRRHLPGCDPISAVDLLAPIAALRQVVIYQRFLDEIEQSERIYHAADPALWLRRAADLETSLPMRRASSRNSRNIPLIGLV